MNAAAQTPPLLAAADTMMHREAHERRSARSSASAGNATHPRSPASPRRLLRTYPPRFVVTSARGSSDHAATFAKYVFETQLRLRDRCRSSPSVSSIYAAPLRLEGALYGLAISAIRKESRHRGPPRAGARSRAAHVVALVNCRGLAAGRGSRQRRAAAAPVPELSVAATKRVTFAAPPLSYIWPARWNRRQGASSAALAAVPRSSCAADLGPGLVAARRTAWSTRATCSWSAAAWSPPRKPMRPREAQGNLRTARRGDSAPPKAGTARWRSSAPASGAVPDAGRRQHLSG